MVEGIVVKVRHGVEAKFVKMCEGLYNGVETRVMITSKLKEV